MAVYKEDFKNAFINPYNFVRLGGDVVRNIPAYGENTGYISCKVHLTTPMFIPDTESAKADENKHKTMPFYNVGGKCIIPGSELRGVIRSAYETLSNSCLSVNNNNTLSARSSVPRNPGIIQYKDNSWHLYEATQKRLKYDNSDDFDETPSDFKRIWMNYRYKNRIKDSDYKVKVTYRFSTSFKEVECEDLEQAVKDYCEVNEIYKSNDKTDQLKSIMINPKKDGKCYPVYYLTYSVDGKEYAYLSPAQLSRSVFHNRVDDLLGSHARCRQTDNVCAACGLFGMIGENVPKGKAKAVASRLRFTDAEITTEPEFSVITLKELSGPKISSVEFYSRIPDTDKLYLWNYDTDEVTLNGRKFYFHHTGNFAASEPNKRNITAQLLKENAEFNFRIYFDHITDEELHCLVWTLAIGDNRTDSSLQHKIGHGKPLGLGSVKITVNNVMLRSFDADECVYREEEKDVDSYFKAVPFDTESCSFKDYIKISDFDTVKGKNVCYPIADKGESNKNATASHVWFTANRNHGKTSSDPSKIPVGYTLPRLADSKLILPAYKADTSNKGGSGYNSSPKGSGKNSYHGPKDAPKKRTVSVKCKFCGAVMEKVPSGFGRTKQEVECTKCGKKFKAEF